MPDERAPAERLVRPLWLRIAGWIAYLAAVAVLVVFIVLWVHNQIPRAEQVYPLPGVAAGLLILGIWTSLGPWLYRSRTTVIRFWKYVAAIVLTIIFYPLVVTLLGAFAQWIVSLIPGSPLH